MTWNWLRFEAELNEQGGEPQPIDGGDVGDVDEAVGVEIENRPKHLRKQHELMLLKFSLQSSSLFKVLQQSLSSQTMKQRFSQRNLRRFVDNPSLHLYAHQIWLLKGFKEWQWFGFWVTKGRETWWVVRIELGIRWRRQDRLWERDMPQNSSVTFPVLTETVHSLCQ